MVDVDNYDSDFSLEEQVEASERHFANLEKLEQYPALEPCMCCGDDEAEVFEHPLIGRIAYWVGCPCGMRTGICNTPQEAGAIWNRREPLDDFKDFLRNEKNEGMRNLDSEFLGEYYEGWVDAYKHVLSRLGEGDEE